MVFFWYALVHSNHLFILQTQTASEPQNERAKKVLTTIVEGTTAMTRIGEMLLRLRDQQRRRPHRIRGVREGGGRRKNSMTSNERRGTQERKKGVSVYHGRSVN